MPKIIRDTIPTLEESRFKLIKREVEEDNGGHRDQYIWMRGNFVVVVPVDKDSNIFVKKEFKYGVFAELLTFAAGGVKPGELPEQAAERELMQEFGMTAVKLEPLQSNLRVSPDKSTEGHFIFVAHVSDERKACEAGEVLKFAKGEEHLLLDRPEMKIALMRLCVYEYLNHNK